MTSPSSNSTFLHPTHCVVPAAFLERMIAKAVEEGISRIIGSAPVGEPPAHYPKTLIPVEEEEEEIEDPMNPDIRIREQVFGVPKGFRPAGRLKVKTPEPTGKTE